MARRSRKSSVRKRRYRKTRHAVTRHEDPYDHRMFEHPPIKMFKYQEVYRDDPREYDEGYLEHSTDQGRYRTQTTIGLRKKEKIYDPWFCQKKAIRRAILFAKGMAGASGRRLNKRDSDRRTRRYRNTYHNRVKCR